MQIIIFYSALILKLYSTVNALAISELDQIKIFYFFINNLNFA